MAGRMNISSEPQVAPTSWKTTPRSSTAAAATPTAATSSAASPTRVYLVSAKYFECATERKRLLGVCFHSAAAMDAFEPPLALSAKCRPLARVVKSEFNDPEAFADLFLSKELVSWAAKEKSVPIAGLRAQCGMRTITCVRQHRDRRVDCRTWWRWRLAGPL